jgi:hypothetical protein
MHGMKDLTLYTTSIVRVVIGAAPQDKPHNHYLLRSLAPIGAFLVIVLYLMIPLTLLLHVVVVWLFSLIGTATLMALVEALIVITLMRIDSVRFPVPVTRPQGKPKPMQSIPDSATKAVAAIIAPQLKLPAYSGRRRAWSGIKGAVVDVPRLKLPARG